MPDAQLWTELHTVGMALALLAILQRCEPATDGDHAIMPVLALAAPPVLGPVVGA